jgi:hypothetical protein
VKLHFRMFLRSLDTNTTGFISLEMKNIAKELLETVEMNPFLFVYGENSNQFRHTREHHCVPDRKRLTFSIGVSTFRWWSPVH